MLSRDGAPDEIDVGRDQAYLIDYGLNLIGRPARPTDFTTGCQVRTKQYI